MAYLLGALLIAVLAVILALRLLVLHVELTFDHETEGDRFLVRITLPPFLSYETHKAPGEQDEDDSAPKGKELAAGYTVSPPDGAKDQGPLDSASRAQEQAKSVMHQITVVHETLQHLVNGRFPTPRSALLERRWLRWVLRALARSRWYVDEFTWVTRVGAGDAALTGLVSGLLWGVVATAFAILRRRMIFEAPGPVVRVVPVFTEAHFETRLHCIVRVRLGHIISAGLGWTG